MTSQTQTKTSSSERPIYANPRGRQQPEWSYCMHVDPETYETCGKPDPRVFVRIEIPLEMVRNVWLTERTEQRINSAAIHPADRGCFLQMDVTLCDEHRTAVAPTALWVDALTVQTSETEQTRKRRINGGGRKPSIEPVPAGTKYGKLTTLEDADRVTQIVRVRCDCGVETTKMLGNMRNGQTKSCGCLQDEYRQRARDGQHPWKTPR